MGSRENSPFFFVFYHRERHLIINMIIKILKFTWRKKTSLNITALTRLPGSTWALTSYNGYCDRAWWNYDTSLQTFSSRVIILSPNFFAGSLSLRLKVPLDECCCYLNKTEMTKPTWECIFSIILHECTVTVPTGFPSFFDGMTIKKGFIFLLSGINF